MPKKLENGVAQLVKMNKPAVSARITHHVIRIASCFSIALETCMGDPLHLVAGPMQRHQNGSSDHSRSWSDVCCFNGEI